MINGAQLHLAVNHMPVVGVLFGFLILFVGMLMKNSSVKKTGLAVLVFASVTVAPAYLSGEPAEDMVEHKPGVTKALIHEHEDSAELSLVFTAITGGVAALALALGKMKRIAGFSGKCSSGMMGTKSLPSAPSPWSQMIEALGFGAVSISMQGNAVINVSS
jgi:multisubunit Na+/H+ antiporter MnhC subunit